MQMPGSPDPIMSLLMAAVEHHRHGRLALAEGLYRQVLAQQPNHADALRLLGVLAHQAGRGDIGVELIGRAISLMPGSPDGYAALGQVLAGLGRLGEAVDAYQRARAIDPRSPDLCNDMGNVLLGLSRLDEATALYEHALSLRRDFPEAYNNLGTVRIQQGRNDEAIAACEKALSLRSDFVEARCNLGIALRQSGRFDQAIAVLSQVLANHPQIIDAAMNLAEAYRQSGRADQAMQLARRTALANPNHAAAQNALGVLLLANRDFIKALAAFTEAIRLQSDFAEAHYNLGSVLSELNQEEAAIAAFEKALRFQPQMVQAWNNMGNALLNVGRYGECIESQRRAIALKPDQASAHFNLGVALITTGNLIEGFREMEWRWQTPELSLSRRRFSQPRWNGEPLDGRTILLHAEQGFGDTIQFVRYVPRVAECGGRVVLACQSELAGLVGQVPGIAQVVTEKDRLPPFDLHCALMSLPLVLGTMLDTIPASVPYLRAMPEQAERWRARTEPHRDRLKVGLAWAGRPTHSHDRRRSISFAMLSQIAQPGVCFFSLQKGPAAEQAKNPPGGMELIDWSSDLTDFTETAGLMDQLDLVITIDSAVAHLAGAMGKPVWVLLPFAPDWRWMLERTDSPWYPTMRLFRQSQMDDWNGPIQQVARALADH